MERATRHKSCVACIQTKRKCDRTQPKCQRCTARGSDCHYIGRSRMRQQQVVEQSVLEQSLIRTAAEWRPQILEVEHMTSAALFPPTSNEDIFDFPHHPFNLPFDDQSLVPSIGDLAAEPQPHTGDPDSKLYTRVEYCAGRLSLLPSLFATTGQTMFIHHQTFQAMHSTTLQQAMSACALYTMRTPASKPLVHQVIQHNVQDLLATTNPTTTRNQDLLAALQALLLYQLMRLFDGDIRLRASAEADEATTVLWASELRTRVCAHYLPQNPVARFSDDTKDWAVWLFSESIRRTVVTTFLVRGVYNYLKTCTDSPTVVGVYFTVQEGLWNAQSEAGWNRAKHDKMELQVLVNDWDNVMALAGPADLEELGVLVMSMLWGLRATRNWLGRESSAKHGLEALL
ncbi:transcription factor cys6 protein [Stagonosporopsis vannaccii]|nr:transcription factor cys6 protein [Stagonosporopsis vannaccii]